MSEPILTFLTKMNKLLDVPKFVGPLATIAFTIVYHLIATYFGFTIAVGWLWVFAVVGAFIGGRRAGLVAAAWAGLYAYYVMPAGDWGLTAQRVVIGFILPIIVGWQTWHLRRALFESQLARAAAQASLERAEKNEAAAQALGALNGNILRIRHSRNLLLKILEQQRLDEMAREELRAVLHVLNNLEQATAGWQELAKMKGWLGD